MLTIRFQELQLTQRKCVTPPILTAFAPLTSVQMLSSEGFVSTALVTLLGLTLLGLAAPSLRGTFCRVF